MEIPPEIIERIIEFLVLDFVKHDSIGLNFFDYKKKFIDQHLVTKEWCCYAFKKLNLFPVYFLQHIQEIEICYVQVSNTIKNVIVFTHTHIAVRIFQYRDFNFGETEIEQIRILSGTMKEFWQLQKNTSECVDNLNFFEDYLRMIRKIFENDPDSIIKFKDINTSGFTSIVHNGVTSYYHAIEDANHPTYDEINLLPIEEILE